MSRSNTWRYYYPLKIIFFLIFLPAVYLGFQCFLRNITSPLQKIFMGQGFSWVLWPIKKNGDMIIPSRHPSNWNISISYKQQDFMIITFVLQFVCGSYGKPTLPVLPAVCLWFMNWETCAIFCWAHIHAGRWFNEILYAHRLKLDSVTMLWLNLSHHFCDSAFIWIQRIYPWNPTF